MSFFRIIWFLLGKSDIENRIIQLRVSDGNLDSVLDVVIDRMSVDYSGDTSEGTIDGMSIIISDGGIYSISMK